jgi:hypothetical protein
MICLMVLTYVDQYALPPHPLRLLHLLHHVLHLALIPIIFIIFRVSSNCFSSLFTSGCRVPLPVAMRWRYGCH